MRKLMLGFIVFLSGCVHSHREAEAEARGYERGYRQAVKEQYWIIQNLQRNAGNMSTP